MAESLRAEAKRVASTLPSLSAEARARVATLLGAGRRAAIPGRAA